MPTPSGQIGLRDVNLELGKAATAQIGMNDTAVRTLAGKPAGQISMQDLQNKSNITIVTSLAYSGNTYTAQDLSDGYAESQLQYNTDGTFAVQDIAPGATSLLTGNWATPTTAGVGSGYWVRFTRSSATLPTGATATATTGWLQLSSQQAIVITQSNDTTTTRTASATYTVELSNSSSGTNILATATITIRAISRFI